MSYREKNRRNGRKDERRQLTELVYDGYLVKWYSKWMKPEELGRVFGEIVNTVGALRKSALAEEPTFLIEHGVDIDLEEHRKVRDFHTVKGIKRYRKYLERLLEKTPEPRAIVCARPNDYSTIFEYWTANEERQTTIAIEVGKGGSYFRISGFAELPAVGRSSNSVPMSKIAWMMEKNLRKINGISLEETSSRPVKHSRGA